MLSHTPRYLGISSIVLLGLVTAALVPLGSMQNVQASTPAVSAPANSNASPSSDHDLGDFSVSGFGSSDELLVSIGFVGAPSGTTFSLTAGTANLEPAPGYASTWTSLDRVSFYSTQAEANVALASMSVNSGAATGSFQVKVSATLTEPGLVYNPKNDHFYKYVSTPTTWPNALAAAPETSAKGVPGYLATITSADESSFIATNVTTAVQLWVAGAQVKGDTIGSTASDAVWKWVAGPESGTEFWADPDSGNGGQSSNPYADWCTGEPNNNVEPYVVIRWQSTGDTECWNDYGPSQTTGYIIEYGSNEADKGYTGVYTATTTVAVAPVPAPPVSLAGTQGAANNSIDLSWGAPSNGGSVITRYVVEYRVSGTSSYAEWTTAEDPLTDTQVTVTGLDSCTAYDFRVYAVNANGDGSPSSVSVTAFGSTGLTSYSADNFILRGDATEAAGRVTLTPDAGAKAGAVWSGTRLDLSKSFCVEAHVTLSADADTSGADGVAFVLQPSDTTSLSTGGGLGYYSGVKPSLALEFDTYENGTSLGDSGSGQDITLVTLDKTGAADWTAFDQPNYNVTTNSYVLEDAKDHATRIRFDAAKKTLTVFFDLNADRDFADPGESVMTNRAADLAAFFAAQASTTKVYWGFTAATGGSMNLQQVSTIRYSPGTLTANTPPTATAPASQTVVPGASTTVAVAIDDSGETTQGQWRVSATSANTAYATVGEVVATSATSANVLVNGVADGTTEITLTAVDADGASTTATFSVAVGRGSITAQQASAGNGQATVSWTAPGGATPSGYTVTSTPGDKTCSTTTTSCTVVGLTNGTSYTFTVVATFSGTEATSTATTAAVTPVSSAPTVTGPASATATVGSAVTLGSFTIADPFTCGWGTMTATVSAATGTFSATASGAATLAGTGTSTLTVTGNRADVASTLATVSYTPSAAGASTVTTTVVPSVDFVAPDGKRYHLNDETGHYCRVLSAAEVAAGTGTTQREKAENLARGMTFCGFAGYLVAVDDAAEQAFIETSGAFKAFLPNPPTMYTSGIKDGGSWTWKPGNGAPAGYPFAFFNQGTTAGDGPWHDGEPNNSGVYHTFWYTNSVYGWDDFGDNNTATYGALVEFGATTSFSIPSVSTVVTATAVNNNGGGGGNQGGNGQRSGDTTTTPPATPTTPATLPPRLPFQPPSSQNNVNFPSGAQPLTKPVVYQGSNGNNEDGPRALVGGQPSPVQTRTDGPNGLNVTTGNVNLGLGLTNPTGGGGVSQNPRTNTPELQVPLGHSTTFRGGGLQPGSMVQVWMPGVSGMELSRVPVAADGSFETEVPFRSQPGGAPLPIGRQVIQVTGVDREGNQTVVEMTVTIAQGQPSPEFNRDAGRLPQMGPGQSLATSAGIPTLVQVTPFADQNSVSVQGDGWSFNVNVGGGDGAVGGSSDSPLIQFTQSGTGSVSGDGFQAGTLASVWLFSEPTLLGTVTVAEDGSFTASFVVDESLIPAGEHTLQIQGVGIDGYIKAANLGVDVAPVSSLTTAQSAFGLLGWGMGFLIALLAIVLVVWAFSRRQRSQYL